MALVTRRFWLQEGTVRLLLPPKRRSDDGVLHQEGYAERLPAYTRICTTPSRSEEIGEPGGLATRNTMFISLSRQYDDHVGCFTHGEEALDYVEPSHRVVVFQQSPKPVRSPCEP